MNCTMKDFKGLTAKILRNYVFQMRMFCVIEKSLKYLSVYTSFSERNPPCK